MHQARTIEGDPCHRLATYVDGSPWLQHAPCLCSVRIATIDGQTFLCASWKKLAPTRRNMTLCMPDRYASVSTKLTNAAASGSKRYAFQCKFMSP